MTEIAHHHNHGIVGIVGGDLLQKGFQLLQGLVEGLEVQNEVLPVLLRCLDIGDLGGDPSVLLVPPVRVPQGKVRVDLALFAVDTHVFVNMK